MQGTADAADIWAGTNARRPGLPGPALLFVAGAICASLLAAGGLMGCLYALPEELDPMLFFWSAANLTLLTSGTIALMSLFSRAAWARRACRIFCLLFLGLLLAGLLTLTYLIRPENFSYMQEYVYALVMLAGGAAAVHWGWFRYFASSPGLVGVLPGGRAKRFPERAGLAPLKLLCHLFLWSYAALALLVALYAGIYDLEFLRDPEQHPFMALLLITNLPSLLFPAAALLLCLRGKASAPLYVCLGAWIFMTPFWLTFEHVFRSWLNIGSYSSVAILQLFTFLPLYKPAMPFILTALWLRIAIYGDEETEDLARPQAKAGNAFLLIFTAWSGLPLILLSSQTLITNLMLNRLQETIKFVPYGKEFWITLSAVILALFCVVCLWLLRKEKKGAKRATLLFLGGALLHGLIVGLFAGLEKHSETSSLFSALTAINHAVGRAIPPFIGLAYLLARSFVQTHKPAEKPNEDAATLLMAPPEPPLPLMLLRAYCLYIPVSIILPRLIFILCTLPYTENMLTFHNMLNILVNGYYRMTDYYSLADQTNFALPFMVVLTNILLPLFCLHATGRGKKAETLCAWLGVLLVSQCLHYLLAALYSIFYSPGNWLYWFVFSMHAPEIIALMLIFISYLLLSKQVGLYLARASDRQYLRG